MTRPPSKAVREVAKLLAGDGWVLVEGLGGARARFRHPCGAELVATPGPHARVLADARRAIRQNGRPPSS